jgi:TonB family protein
MAALEIGPAHIGLDTGRFKPASTAAADAAAAKPGGPGGNGSDAEASQAGLRASAQPLAAQTSGLARANRGQGTQIAAQESAMAGLESTAANAFCKLPTANETNLLKAAKGAPRLISGTPMFNPVWVPPGSLILRVHVLANGEPDQVLVKESSGSNILDEEAVNQIRSARFQPGERDGRITDYWVAQPRVNES